MRHPRSTQKRRRIAFWTRRRGRRGGLLSLPRRGKGEKTRFFCVVPAGWGKLALAFGKEGGGRRCHFLCLAGKGKREEERILSSKGIPECGKERRRGKDSFLPWLMEGKKKGKGDGPGSFD